MDPPRTSHRLDLFGGGNRQQAEAMTGDGLVRPDRDSRRAGRVVGASRVLMAMALVAALPEVEARAAEGDLVVQTGLRYWYSEGTTQKQYSTLDGKALNSRVTYRDMEGHSGEFFLRADHRSGLFAKGAIGVGGLPGGSLEDEDFFGRPNPTSTTWSAQKQGTMVYGHADLGLWVWPAERWRLGLFTGYGAYRESANAYGCAQSMLSVPGCGPGIPASTRVLSDDGTWQSLRLGLAGEIRLADRWSLQAEAVWLPYTWLENKDTHWLRFGVPGDFRGLTHEVGRGHDGVQIEAVLSYQVTPAVSLGVGGRYWRMTATGSTRIGTDAAGDWISQPSRFETERYGGFVQVAVRF